MTLYAESIRSLNQEMGLKELLLLPGSAAVVTTGQCIGSPEIRTDLVLHSSPTFNARIFPLQFQLCTQTAS